MKKKILAALLATLIMMAILTGCMKAEMDVSINLIGQISARILLVFENGEDGTPAVKAEDVLKMISTTLLDDLKEQGFTVTEYNQDGYSGLLIENKKVDTSKMNFEGEQQIDYSVTVENGKLVADIPLAFINNYAIYLDQAKEQITEKGGYARISLTAPIKPASHNADEVSKNGRTLSWDLFKTTEKESLHVEYSIVTFALIWVGIVGGVAAVVVGTVLVIKAVTKKKKLSAAPQAQEVNK